MRAANDGLRFLLELAIREARRTSRTRGELGRRSNGDPGLLLIDHPGRGEDDNLDTIFWDEFFKGFEENELAFLYQEETAEGDESRFSKLVRR